MNGQALAIEDDGPDSHLIGAAFTRGTARQGNTHGHVVVASKDAGQPPCVLVVDDEPYIVEFLCLLLEEEGYRVLRASNGRQAWELARESHPDLVISDVMMPGMTGLQLLDQLRNSLDLTATRVILMSAVSRSMDSPGVAFVPKPFDINEMLELVSGELMVANERRLEGVAAR